MSRRSEQRRQLNDEFDGYDVNVDRALKRASKDLNKLKEAQRRRNKNYAKRKRGDFIFRRG
ncbi:MAG: hypothetical protein WC196_07010 [Bacilli bacterium]